MKTKPIFIRTGLLDPDSVNFSRETLAMVLKALRPINVVSRINTRQFTVYTVVFLDDVVTFTKVKS